MKLYLFKTSLKTSFFFKLSTKSIWTYLDFQHHTLSHFKERCLSKGFFLFMTCSFSASPISFKTFWRVKHRVSSCLKRSSHFLLLDSSDIFLSNRREGIGSHPSWSQFSDQRHCRVFMTKKMLSNPRTEYNRMWDENKKTRRPGIRRRVHDIRKYVHCMIYKKETTNKWRRDYFER